MQPNWLQRAGEQFGFRRRNRAQIEAPPAPVRTDSALMEKFRQFASRPEVSGIDAHGPLAAQRDPRAAPTVLDAQIANNISNYLKSNYSYTLDLTDTRKLNDGSDPLLAFLTDYKKGHCEYFAGAMTLLVPEPGDGGAHGRRLQVRRIQFHARRGLLHRPSIARPRLG